MQVLLTDRPINDYKRTNGAETSVCAWRIEPRQSQKPYRLLAMAAQQIQPTGSDVRAVCRLPVRQRRLPERIKKCRWLLDRRTLPKWNPQPKYDRRALGHHLRRRHRDG